MKYIILLSGLIASGKTTVGIKLAEKFNKLGKNSVFFDIDIELAKLNPSNKWGSKKDLIQTWMVARKNLALNSTKVLGGKSDVVIIAGPFFYKKDVVEFKKCLTFKRTIRLFILDAPLNIRVERNKNRRYSNDPKNLEDQKNKLSSYPSSLPVININNSGSLGKTVDLIYGIIKNKKKGLLTKYKV